MKKITLGYTIGRFNPLHLGHVSMLNPMIKDNDYSLILVGSANQQRTEKNPLTYAERAHLLTHLYPNTIVLPLNDFNDEQAWINEVDRKIKETLSILNIDFEQAEVNLYTGGAQKGEDQSSEEPNSICLFSCLSRPLMRALSFCISALFVCSSACRSVIKIFSLFNSMSGGRYSSPSTRPSIYCWLSVLFFFDGVISGESEAAH